VASARAALRSIIATRHGAHRATSPSGVNALALILANEINRHKQTSAAALEAAHLCVK